VQQRLFIDRYSSKCGLTDLHTHDGQQLRRWLDSRLYQRLLSILREADLDGAILDGHPVWDSARKYEALLHEHRYLDYTMIVKEAVVELQRNADLRRQIAASLRFVIVDEYQDVNPLQECLIKLLHGLGAQLCVVGDDDQTIYQWNGSDIRNIRTFAERYPHVTRVEMGDNFRSTTAIVETARRIAERNTDRLPESMSAAGHQVFERGDIVCRGFRTPSDEAAWVADKIQTMRGVPFRDSPQGPERGLSWSDCAVLLRTVKHSAEPIVHALRDAGIPYVVKGMNRLFETAEVRAAEGIFLYLNGDVTMAELRQRWLDANVGLVDADLVAAIENLDERKSSWDQPQRRSTRGLQKTYLGFLTDIGLREERVPAGEGGAAQASRSEIVLYNFGKFSQIVADYEQVHFQSDPVSLHQGFAGFLVHQAPDYYPEGWEDAAYCSPDAVQIMTVHQAKGMEFPVVFVPNLVKNRFPSRRQGGRQWFHVVPENAVRNADAYRGREEDERRLLYVALTRSKKHLFCSWAPEAAKGQYSQASSFIGEITASEFVLTRDPEQVPARRIPPTPRHEEIQLSISFTELRYFFDCPYQFKLRFLYGFRPGAHEELGFGKSLHDALAEVHRRAMAGAILPSQEAPRLVREHLHLPFAYEKLRADMAQKAEAVLRRYLWDNRSRLSQTEYAEKTIELPLADGLLVSV